MTDLTLTRLSLPVHRWLSLAVLLVILDHGAVGRDVRFEMTFSEGRPVEVPEPISMLLLGTGLVGIAAVRRRRRFDALEA